MVDNKKEQERDELHRAIWAIADNLRGAVDGWDFKNYVLGAMFYRYISENLTEYINSFEDDDFDYAQLSDEEATCDDTVIKEIINEKGIFIKPSELFCNVLKNASANENLNETLKSVFDDIENSSRGSTV